MLKLSSASGPHTNRQQLPRLHHRLALRVAPFRREGKSPTSQKVDVPLLSVVRTECEWDETGGGGGQVGRPWTRKTKKWGDKTDNTALLWLRGKQTYFCWIKWTSGRPPRGQNFNGGFLRHQQRLKLRTPPVRKAREIKNIHSLMGFQSWWVIASGMTKQKERQPINLDIKPTGYYYYQVCVCSMKPIRNESQQNVTEPIIIEEVLPRLELCSGGWDHTFTHKQLRVHKLWWPHGGKLDVV